MNRRVILTIVLAFAFSASACKKSDPKPGTTQTPSTGSETKAAGGDMAAAMTLYKQRCSTCHGDSGKGDGPGAVALNPKPRNYADAKWQASITDADLAKVIVEGGPALKKSPLMPPNPDLKAKPEVVNGLVKYIRSFAKK